MPQYINVLLRMLLPHSTAPSSPRSVTITRVFENGIELNWISPREPNGEVRFGVTVSSNTMNIFQRWCGHSHCNVTRLQKGVRYSIQVLAFNNINVMRSTFTRSTALTYEHTLDVPTVAGECFEILNVLCA